MYKYFEKKNEKKSGTRTDYVKRLNNSAMGNNVYEV